MTGLAWSAARLLIWVRGIVFVLAALSLGLLVIPQAQDLLVTLGQTRSVLPWLISAATLMWLSVSAWFWSGYAIENHDGVDAVAGPGPRLWVPRLLGLVPFAAVAAALNRAAGEVPGGMQALMGPALSGARPLAIAATVVGAAGLAILCAGLALVPARSATGRVRSVAGAQDQGAATLVAAAAVLLGAAGMALYGAIPVRAGALIQSLPTVLLAAAGLMCGATLIARAGARTGLPILAVVIIGALVLADLRDADILPDNHDIRALPGALPPRPGLREAFHVFLARTGPAYGGKPVPVVLVAASGGGLAASVWTATILGDLADTIPEFRTQLFAVSGVSGGALGALESVALMQDRAAVARCGGVRACAGMTLGADFLSPVLGALLYADTMQRFLPFPVFEDRAAALEHAWEARWRAVTGDALLSGPFLGLWPADRPWPALLLNGTSVLTGGRAITSNLDLAADDPGGGPPMPDLLAEWGVPVRASTAADNSARFPYISPAGAVRSRTPDHRITDLVVDGGYFENFGATTLLQILDALDAAARSEHAAVRFAVLQIIGAPPQPPAVLGGSLIPRAISGPLLTLARTRDARGSAATSALAERVASLGGVYVTLRLGTSPTGQSAPLGWSLPDVAQHAISAQWTDTCRAHVAALLALSPASTAPQSAAPAAMLAGDPCLPEQR